MGTTFNLRLLDRPPVPESRKNTLSVVVDRPAAQVFEFATNPKCTPLWVDGIVKEERSEEPTRMGTKYWNVNREGKWTSYLIVDYEANRAIEFEMESKYHCRYTFEELPGGKTKLTYSEWAVDGSLEDPFQQAALDRFKAAIESQSPIAPFLRKAEAQLEKEEAFDEAVGIEDVNPEDLRPDIRKRIERSMEEGEGAQQIDLSRDLGEQLAELDKKEKEEPARRQRAVNAQGQSTAPE